MKNVWKVVLSVYLVLVTVGCAVFCGLFFLTRGGEKLTAHQLVNNVCYDLGIVSREQADGTEASAESEETFADDKIDLSYGNIPTTIEGVPDLGSWTAMPFFMARAMVALDENGKAIYNANTNYVISGQVQNPGQPQKNNVELHFRYTFDGTTFHASMIVGDGATYSQQTDMKIIAASDKDWEAELCIYYSGSDLEKNPSNDVYYFNAKSDNKGPYYAAANLYSRAGNLRTPVANVSAASEVERMDVLELDAVKHKKTVSTKADFNDAKLVEKANQVINAAHKIGRDTFTSETTFTEGDEAFIESYYADMATYMASAV